MTPDATAAGVGWQSSAACGGTNYKTFFTAQPAEAKEICGGCPVRVECLYDALESQATNGIWGGLTYKERRALPALPADRAAALAVLVELRPAAAAPVPAVAAKPKKTVAKAKKKAAPARRKKKAAAPKPKATAAVREDVAELLRAGRTLRQIREQLRVSTRTVVATRQAYNIPYPKGPGFRYTPEQRADNERRTLELLKAGATSAEITEQVGISAPTILAIRRKAGLPRPVRCGGQARTKAEAFAASTEPYGDGHVRWTGPTAGRMAQLWADSRRFNGRHVAFEQHHGRPPVGYVRSNCGEQDCMAGAHLTDDVLRRAQPEEEPVTVQALKDLLDEIDEQGGPQAARDKRLNLTRPAGPTTEEPDPMPTTDPAEPKPTAPGPRPSIAQATAEVTVSALPLADLLAWGDEHPDPAVQDQAARGRAILTGLRNRHATDQELAALATKRQQLEKQLAALTARQAELAPPKKTKRKTGVYVRDYDARTVRAWAAEHGVDCPGVGQIPKRVLDAWRTAHASAGGAV